MNDAKKLFPLPGSPWIMYMLFLTIWFTFFWLLVDLFWIPHYAENRLAHPVEFRSEQLPRKYLSSVPESVRLFQKLYAVVNVRIVYERSHVFSKDSVEQTSERNQLPYYLFRVVNPPWISYWFGLPAHDFIYYSHYLVFTGFGSSFAWLPLAVLLSGSCKNSRFDGFSGCFLFVLVALAETSCCAICSAVGTFAITTIPTIAIRSDSTSIHCILLRYLISGISIIEFKTDFTRGTASCKSKLMITMLSSAERTR